jgi:hypothetical protein
MKFLLKVVVFERSKASTWVIPLALFVNKIPSITQRTIIQEILLCMFLTNAYQRIVRKFTRCPQITIIIIIILIPKRGMTCT